MGGAAERSCGGAATREVTKHGTSTFIYIFELSCYNVFKLAYCSRGIINVLFYTFFYYKRQIQMRPHHTQLLCFHLHSYIKQYHLKTHLFTSSLTDNFYPRDAMLARVIAIATCLSVRLSVRHTPVLCQKRRKLAA